jgi:hypothetical protein
MLAAISPLIITDTPVSVVVAEDPCGPQHDLDIPQQRPFRDIFEIGLEPLGEVLLPLGRAAVAAHLRKAGQPRLEAVALPVLAVDLPEELVVRLGTDRVRAEADDRHVAGRA